MWKRLSIIMTLAMLAGSVAMAEEAPVPTVAKNGAELVKKDAVKPKKGKKIRKKKAKHKKTESSNKENKKSDK